MKKLLYMGLSALMMLLAFMDVGKAQEVTFSPDPTAGNVTVGQEITINYSGSATVYYRLYSSMSEAQNDPVFNGNGDDAAFWNAYGSTLIDYGSTHPVITTGKTVIRVGLHNNNWVKTDIYAEYTIAGGETPEQPTTPAVPLTFKPASGTEVDNNKPIVIQADSEDPVELYYKLYASLEDAKADDATWADKTNLTKYTNSTAPKITANNTVIKAAAWLTDKWDVFSYAEYTIKVEETVPDYTLAFDPDNDNNVEAGQFITINATPELTSNFSIYYQLHASIEAANAATWEEGSLWPTDMVTYLSYDRPQITSEKPVLRAGVLNKKTYKWVASSKTVKEYTIGQTREPFVISFAPEADEEVDANTSVTLSTTPALSEGFKLYYEMFASESAAKGKTWTSGNADAPSLGSMTEYTAARKPIITDTMPVVRAAVWNASTHLWESDTVVTYTVKQVEEPIVLTFTPASGAKVAEGDTVKIVCSDESLGIFFMMFDTEANAKASSDEDWQDGKIEYGEPIEDEEDLGYPVITKEKPVIKAGYGIPDEDDNITWYFTYAVYTVKEETPVSGKATVKLVVDGGNCTLNDRNQYQLLLDKNHEMADIYAEELDAPYIDANLLPRLYGTASATIPSGLSANNLTAGVDLDKTASIEVDPGVYDIFLLQSYYASWLNGGNGKDIIRQVQIKDGYDPFYVDNITLQADLTYTFLVTFDAAGAHGELIIPVNLQLKEIIGESKPSCALDSMEVSLAIANIGSIDVEQYEVYYAVGNDTVRETANTTLAAGKETLFTFSKKCALKTGEKTVINAAVLVQGETDLEDNFGRYTALRTASAALPAQINTTEMHRVNESDWTLDTNKALVASKNASTPVFSSCFHMEDAGNYRLEYEYICGRYVELPDGEVLVNNIDKYKIRLGKSSANWQEWPVIVNEDTITGSSNYNEFTPKEVFFEITEPGDYAFCIYAEKVNDEDNLKFRNMQVGSVKDYDARFDAFSVRAPRIIPQDWGNATHKIDLNIANRGLKKLDSSDIVILVNDQEAARQAITLNVNEKQTLTVDVPVSGFQADQTIVFSGKIVRKEEVLGETKNLNAEVLVSENTAAFDYLTDFSSVECLQSYTGARIGLIYPVVKTDTVTAIAIGWGEMDENTNIRIAIQCIDMKDGQLVLGDMIHQSTVRRGLSSGMATYEIPAYLLTPGNYFVSVEQLDREAFNLAMDRHPDGSFYSYDITKEKWTLYTQAGYPAIRTVFGSNGKLLTNDALVTAISKPIAGGIFADNEPIVVSVRNNGIETAEIPVYVRVDNTVLEPKTVEVSSYATVDVTFNANLAATDADRHIVITAFTALTDDEDLSNDTLRKEVVSFVPADPYRMDFESCLDFATEGFNPAWTSFSFDMTPVLPLRHVLEGEFHYVDFPGSETDLGFIAFNPYETEPSMLFYEFYDNCRPHSGQRFGASLAINDPDITRDDWLVSPKLKMPSQNTQLSMWVKAFDRVFSEWYEIWVSEGSGDPAGQDFTRVYPPHNSDEQLVATGAKWENVVFDLSEYNGLDIHVAIRCVTADAPMFMVDDIVIGENAANEQAQSADFRVTVHPNPVHEMMTILSPDASIKEVAIFNLSGMLIHQSASNLGTGNYRFNANGLLSGMYFARITTDKGIAVRKFIVR